MTTQSPVKKVTVSYQKDINEKRRELREQRLKELRGRIGKILSSDYRFKDENTSS